MSPSKRVNKTDTEKKTKSAQKPKEKASARSTRVTAKKVQAKTGNKGRVPEAVTGKKRSVRKKASQPAQVSIPVEMAVAVSIPLQPDKPKTSLQTNLLRALALLAVIGITLYIYRIRDRV